MDGGWILEPKPRRVRVRLPAQDFCMNWWHVRSVRFMCRGVVFIYRVYTCVSVPEPTDPLTPRHLCRSVPQPGGTGTP